MESATAGRRGANVHFPPPLVFLGFTLLGLVLRYTIGAIPVHSGDWTKPVGILLLLGGIATVVSARVWFSRTGQSPIPWKPTHELNLRGPYRITRTPMHVVVTSVEIGLVLT